MISTPQKTPLSKVSTEKIRPILDLWSEGSTIVSKDRMIYYCYLLHAVY